MLFLTKRCPEISGHFVVVLGFFLYVKKYISKVKKERERGLRTWIEILRISDAKNIPKKDLETSSLLNQSTDNIFALCTDSTL